MDIVNDFLPGLLSGDVTVMAAASLPEVGVDPPFGSGTLRGTLFHCFENERHIVFFVQRI